MNTFKIGPEDLEVMEAPSAVKLAQEIYRKMAPSVCEEWEFEDRDRHLFIWLPKHGFLGGTAMKVLVDISDYYYLSFYASYDHDEKRMFVSFYETRK